MRRPAALLAVALLASSVACGGGEPAKAPAPTPTPPAPPPAPAGDTWTISHVLVGAKAPRLPKVSRDKAAAKQIAESITRQVRGGASFQTMVDTYTDDRDEDGKPNHSPGQPPGTYVFRASDNLAPEFKIAMLQLAVGEMTKEPVETMFGYHVMRRDK